MSKDTMISLSKIVLLLMVDAKWAELQLHPDNINRDSGMEIPEAWMPTIKKRNNRRAVRQRTAEGANHWVNSKDRNAPIRAVEKQLITAEHHAL